MEIDFPERFCFLRIALQFSLKIFQKKSNFSGCFFCFEPSFQMPYSPQVLLFQNFLAKQSCPSRAQLLFSELPCKTRLSFSIASFFRTAFSPVAHGAFFSILNRSEKRPPYSGFRTLPYIIRSISERARFSSCPLRTGVSLSSKKENRFLSPFCAPAMV